MRRLPLRLTLQTRILLLVLVGLTVSYGFFGFLGVAAVSQSTERALEERLVMAQMVADNLDRILSQAQQQLDKIASSGKIRLDNTSLLSKEGLLREIHVVDPDITYQTVVTDSQGKILLADPDSPSLIGMEIDKEPYFREILTMKQAGVYTKSVAPENSRSIFVGRPILDERDNTIGLIGTTIELTCSTVTRLIGPVLLGETGYAQIIDEDGSIIASSATPCRAENGVHAQPFASLIFRGEKTVGTCHNCHKSASGSDLRRDMLAFVPLSTAPWGVAIRQSESEALAPAQDLQQKMIGLGGLSLLTALLLAWFTTRRVVRPVKMLTVASQRIANGDLDTGVMPLGNDEIGILGQSFEDMRGKLRRSLEEIRLRDKELEETVQRRTKELNALVKAAETLIFSLDLDTLLSKIVDAATRTLDADMGALFLYDERLDRLVVRSAAGYDFKALSQVHLKSGEGIVGRVFESGVPLIITNPEEIAGLLKDIKPNIGLQLTAARAGIQPSSALCAPLRTKEKTLGSLILLAKDGCTSFSPSDLPLLAAFAAHVAVLIENARLIKEASLAEAARATDSLKTEFISNISHDLSTPLTSIKASVEVLRLQMKQSPGSPEAKLLANISRNTERLNDLVADLLDMARLQKEILHLNLQSLDMGQIVSDTVDAMAPLFLRRKQALELDIPPDLPHINGDPRRLEQMLLNLLVNASDFTPEGGNISVSVGRDDSSVVVTVTDNGPGIAEEEQQHIFERFYQGSERKARRKRGMGLGLPIAKAIVELHGGKIWVNSRSGTGSTFLFSLPVLKEAGSEDTHR